MSKGQVIVTGASRGIGEAIAIELGRRGFDVVALSRSGKSPVGVGMVCDMTDEHSIASAIAGIGKRGPIIGLVNNAGAHEARRSAELSLSEFEACMRLNASAVLVACREAYPYLAQVGGGTDRQYRILLRPAGRFRKPCLLRLESSSWCHDTMSCFGMGQGRYSGSRRCSGIYRDRSKPRLSRQREGEELAQTAGTRRASWERG